VPPEQQPLNEYQELQESGFFRWALLDLPSYLRRLFWVWAWSWVITGPIAAASFKPMKYPLAFGLTGAIAATLLLTLVVVRLYLGWNYIRCRLSSGTVFYEESGWYDGQGWLKPPEVQTRDRLIVTYQLQPVFQRLHRTFAGLGLGLAIAAGLWWARTALG